MKVLPSPIYIVENFGIFSALILLLILSFLLFPFFFHKKVNIFGVHIGQFILLRRERGMSHKENCGQFPVSRTGRGANRPYVRVSKLFFPVLLLMIMTSAFRIPAVRADDITLGSGAVAKGNVVYFGSYNNKPLTWYVMGPGNAGSGMLLLVTKWNGLEKIQFNPDPNAPNANVWQGSNAQKWCGNFYLNNFSPVEQSAVLMTSKNDRPWWSIYSHGVPGMLFSSSSLINEYVFFLSAEETEMIYYYYDDDGRQVASAGSWLRSPYELNTSYAGYTESPYHSYTAYQSVDRLDWACPAFNLDLSSVLFSSEISSYSYIYYKLTLKDSKLSISITTEKNASREGNAVTVPYTIGGDNAGTGTKAYVMVTDKAYTADDAAILQYSELTAGTEDGTGTFTLDSSITGTWGTDYQVYLLAVNENGDEETDYACEPVELSNPDHVHSFIYAADGATITASDETPGCDITTGLTMTISAPANLVWDGQPKAASLNTDYNTTAFPDTYTISYQGTGSTVYDESTVAPTNAGDYKATVTVGTAVAEVNFTISKAEAVVTAPTARRLIYTGSAQELVDPGSTSDGTLWYALGTDAATAPDASTYTTSIPTGTEIGIYYVWYKLVGGENYADTEAVCLTAEISEKIELTVTFKVVNGSWNDGTTADKTVTLSSAEGEMPKLSAAQIPAAGNKPSAGYKAGSWNVTPDTETFITADTTYTYSYATEGEEEKIEQKPLDTVPAGLTGIYHSIFELRQAMIKKLLQIAEWVVREDQLALYDVEQLISFDSGKTWQPLSEENFPADGLDITLKYPKGTGKDTHIFRLSHMFTRDSKRLGIKAGEIETPEVRAEADGLHTKLRGLSPVLIAWRAIDDEPEQSMDVAMEFINLKQDGSKGVPSEVKSLKVEGVTITLTGDESVSSSEGLMLTLSSDGPAVIPMTVKFNKEIKDLAPGKYTVTVKGLPASVSSRGQIYSGTGSVEGPVEWKYSISVKGEINESDGKMVVRVYLIWDDGSRPVESVRVVALPEDEIGAYALRGDGTKEYLIFQTYDICMAYLGSDDLCAGPERCYHK